MCGAYFFEFRGRNLVCFGIAYNFDGGGTGKFAPEEQLARYTMRYEESDVHLGLYSCLTSANNIDLPTLLTLFYFSISLLTSSSIVAVFLAKAGDVWVC